MKNKIEQLLTANGWKQGAHSSRWIKGFDNIALVIDSIMDQTVYMDGWVRNSQLAVYNSGIVNDNRSLAELEKRTLNQLRRKIFADISKTDNWLRELNSAVDAIKNQEDLLKNQ